MKKTHLMVCGLLILASLALTLALYDRLPERMPVHWGVDGKVDGYGARWSVLLMGPGLMAFLLLLLAVLPKFSPKRFEVDSFEDVYGYVCVVVIASLAYFQAMVMWAVLSAQVDIPAAITGGVAVLIGLIGNVMGKVRRNYWLGIRTPWTLSSERVWYATHRLAAKSMVASAVLCLVGMFAGLPVPVAMLVLGSGALAPAVYSLIYYKRLERSGELDVA